ncbi:MAG: glycosyltransferase family 39 protein, partial [Bacillota bacterium]
MQSVVNHNRDLGDRFIHWLDSRRFTPILLLMSFMIGMLWVSHLSLPLISDMVSYDLWAQSVLDRGHLPVSAYRPPLYPYFVGMIYRMAGYEPQTVYYVQVVLNLGIIAQIERLGREVLDRRTGQLAALLYSVTLTPYILSSGLLTEILFTLLLLGGIYLTIRAAKVGWLP